MIYKGKDLVLCDLWELGNILVSLNAAEARRDIASKHPKFDKMEFPPPNPAFLKLKEAVELEIRKKQENVS